MRAIARYHAGLQAPPSPASFRLAAILAGRALPAQAAANAPRVPGQPIRNMNRATDVRQRQLAAMPMVPPSTAPVVPNTPRLPTQLPVADRLRSLLFR